MLICVDGVCILSLELEKVSQINDVLFPDFMNFTPTMCDQPTAWSRRLMLVKC